jgi:hypothetical protein
LKSLKGRDHLEDVDINERIVLNLDFKTILWEDIKWIDLGQDSKQSWAFVNMVMNLHIL